MSTSESTCWTVIRGAAAGSPADREELARRYLGAVRAYLAARWRGSALRGDLDDATQEVVVECFRTGGAVEAAGAGRVPDFRAFLYGVVRNVARRFESRPRRTAGPLPEVAADDASQSRLFERAWAQAIMAEAAQLRRRAAEAGPEAARRVELLRLRFEGHLPIRAIAEHWGPRRRGCITPMPWPGRSFGPPSPRSWRSISPAVRPNSNRKQPAS
jgi:RNA polymerase sigma-70 factor (ECF subfamily)